MAKPLDSFRSLSILLIAAVHRFFDAPASSFAFRNTTLSAPAGGGFCNSRATSQGAFIHSSLATWSSRRTGVASGWIASVLAKPQGNDLTIAARVQSFEAPSFSWTETGFLATFSARGKVETHLNL